MQCIYGILGMDLTEYMVVYGACSAYVLASPNYVGCCLYTADIIAGAGWCVGWCVGWCLGGLGWCLVFGMLYV